jgi:hypothetical protein
MHGKYQNTIRFNSVRIQRAVLRAVLGRLVSWEPISGPRNGYSVLIGCNATLSSMVGANLRTLSRQDRSNMDRIIMVMDRPKEQIDLPVEKQMRERFPELPLQFIYYTPIQARLLHAIGWGWAYAWLSWSLGIAQVQTRYALLQDFDALLLHPGILEERFRAICERGDQYVGTRWYQGNGVETQDRLVCTPEMIFDCEFVRRQFRPIDLFNHVTVHHGRTVDFDTFLYAQAKSGRNSLLAMREEDMAHPSQMICQFTHLISGRGTLSPERNSLLLIPYFLYFGGEENALSEMITAIQQAKGTTVRFFDRDLDVDSLSRTHTQWLRKLSERIEIESDGFVRPEVQAYWDEIERFVHDKTPEFINR